MTGRDVVAELHALSAPALRLIAGQSDGSRLGGRPQLDESFPWPEKDGRPLSFVAQIDLAEAWTAGGPDWLPSHGRLFFFYDGEDGGWGFSPEHRGSWAVLFDERAETDIAEREAPDPAPPAFRLQRVDFLRSVSLPSEQRLEGGGLLEDDEWETAWAAIRASDGDPPLHRIGGWPRPIQNDTMALECQLASNGVDCGNPDAYRSEAAKRLGPGTPEWRLLLQLDSDDDSDMMWGDSGMLYFWIREPDARARDFSKTWMILQCC